LGALGLVLIVATDDDPAVRARFARMRHGAMGLARTIPQIPALARRTEGRRSSIGAWPGPGLNFQ
jgi:hypothetical protein